MQSDEVLLMIEEGIEPGAQELFEGNKGLVNIDCCVFKKCCKKYKKKGKKHCKSCPKR